MPVMAAVAVGPDSFRRTDGRAWQWAAHVKLSDVWSSGFSSRVSLAQHVQLRQIIALKPNADF